MQTQQLIPHPQFRPDCVRAVSVSCTVVGSWLHLCWFVEGAGELVLPSAIAQRRADGLWQSTCFELFVKPRDGQAYCEFNFAPSKSWAAYDFSDVREGMADRPLSHDPVITATREELDFRMEAALPLSDLPKLPADVSLTCVLEEVGGIKSYWAAAHASAEKPDFHDPSCFAIALGPPHEL